jgi:hypothetical protein
VNLKPTKTITKYSIFLAGALLFGRSSQAHAQSGGVALWTNRYNGPGNSLDWATSVAVDSNGHILVTGYSEGGASSYDYATVAYSNSGAPLWTNRYNGPPGNAADWAMALGVDSSGNSFVTGYSPGNGNDYATVAYSSAGNPLWTNRYTGTGNNGDIAAAIAVDSSGNVFVTGYSIVNGYNPDYTTVSYSNGGLPLWTVLYDGLGNGGDYAKAVAVDSNGNVFVTGQSWNGTNGEYATLKYSGEGTRLWTRRYRGPGDSSANAMAVDSGGNVFVTGDSRSSNALPFQLEYATVAYSGAGVALWTNRFHGPGNGDDNAQAIAMDIAGNVFVTGYSATTNPYLYDYATVAYSNGGAPLWTNRYSGHGNGKDYPPAIAVDGSGNVFVAGSLNTDSGYDYVVVAYSGSGIALWTNSFDGPGHAHDIANRVAVDGSGNVFVTGGSSSGTSYDYATIKYSSSIRPSLSIQKLNNQAILTWTNSGFSVQTAPAITGTFTNIPCATSPYTNPITGSQQYFRLKAN